MIDLHTHSLLSDGALVPSELVRRAEVRGYSAIGITDHADESNLETVISQILRVAEELNREGGVRVVPGVELTHISPSRIPGLVEEARRLGARVVVGHGETLVEPVAPGTNAAYIAAGVDILAHPGLVTAEEASLAAKKGVFFEISARKGHSLSNGHVARMAREHGTRMVLDSDAHSPADLLDDEMALKVALGAGLLEEEYNRMRENAEEIVDKAGR